MTLEKIIWILGQFTTLRKKDAEIDDLLNFAQGQYFGVVKDDKKKVRRFIVYMGVDNQTPSLSVSVNGTATIPSNYVSSEPDAMTVIAKGVQYQVEVLDSETFDHRKSHAIEIPTYKRPIATFMSTYIKFLPKNLQYVNFTYLGSPTPVHYATRSDYGFPQYDGTKSAELLWDEPDQIEIIKIALQELGVIASPQEIKDKAAESGKQKQ